MVPTSMGYLKGVGIQVKLDSDSTDSYWGLVIDQGDHLAVSIGYRSGGTYVTNGTESVAYPEGDFFSLRVVWNSSGTTVYINDVAHGHTTWVDYATQPRFALWFYTSGGTVDSFDAEAGAGATLLIEPSSVFSGNPINALRATLQGATWTSVNPASATLSVDKGIILFQTMETNTVFGFSFQALFQNGTVTVTESEYGAQGTFEISEFPISDNGDDWPLTEDGAGIINRTGEACPEGTILTTCDEVAGEGTPHILPALDNILFQLGGYFGQVAPDLGSDPIVPYLWTLVNGGNAPANLPWSAPARDSSLKVEVETAVDHLTAIRTVNDRTLQDVIDYIQGDPLYTLEGLHADIVAIPPADLSGVLSAISALSDKVDDLQTDVTALGSKLAAIQPSTDYTLTSLHVENAAIGVDTGNLLNLIGLLMGGEEVLTIQTVLDAISALSALLPKAHPVFPGEANVTYGTPVTLVDRLTITEPMDGVIVEYTTAPYRTSHYILGSKDLYYGSGRIAFEDDGGHVEFWQYLGFDTALYVPHSMQRASAVHIQLIGGAQGTVTPWVVSEA